MSIIEKEIARRENLISDNAEKVELAAKLRARADALEAEVKDFDEETLRDEIRELETYLAPEEPEVEPTDNEIVAEPATTFGVNFG